MGFLEREAHATLGVNQRLEPGQVDPGWAVIRAMEKVGLVWNVGTPRPVASREDLEERIASA